MTKKSATLHVKVYYPGVVLEGDFDFDAVAKLKEKYLRYLETGRATGAILYNYEQKKFAVIDLKKVCALEIEKTLIFMDDYEKKWESFYREEY